MQYLLLIHVDEKRWPALTGTEQLSEIKEYSAFGREFGKSIITSDALQSKAPAKIVRVREGRPLITDGPFSETKEQVAGFYVVEAADENEVMAMAARIPWARHGAVEVRPVLRFTQNGNIKTD